MTGAKLVKPGALSLVLGRRLALSNEQKAAIIWSNPGPVPGGG
jgi:hypothetical protein